MKIKLTCVLLLSVFSVATFAGQDRGGGDLCEDRIKVVRDDISKWIKDGGAKNLNLPNDVSVGQYEDEMQNQISKAKIRCVGKGDAGYPVAVDGISKVCRFDLSKKESLITCDFTKFQSMNDNDQYVLVHHEYAGLSNVEKPNGSDSDYSLSNQISGYLVSKVVKQLSIKPIVNNGINESMSLQYLPSKTVIEFPVNNTIYPNEYLVKLPLVYFEKDVATSCTLSLTSQTSDVRLMKGNMSITLVYSPGLDSSGKIFMIHSKITLNGKEVEKMIFTCSNYYSAGGYISYNVTIKKFREYIEALGGKVTLPEIVSF